MEDWRGRGEVARPGQGGSVEFHWLQREKEERKKAQVLISVSCGGISEHLIAQLAFTFAACFYRRRRSGD